MLFSLIPSVACWGSDGHAIVGAIGQAFLDSNAKSYVNQLLSSSSMASVASWADSYKSTSAGSWSKAEHYIDIQDAPPSSCSLVESRDCPNQDCINYAIANHTSQLCSKNTQLATNALKFLIHYFGDVTQPLHNSAKSTGGNSISVTYNGGSSNLHAIWDTGMVQDRMGEKGGQSSYASYLVQQINSGSYASQASGWISSKKYNAVSQYGNNAASLEYSADSDAIDCSYVYPAYNKNQGSDLSGNYYTGAIPYIDQQLAKGGYRLAYHLNQAFAGCSGITPTTTKTSPSQTATTTAKATSTPTTSACAHDKCSTGSALKSSCDSCVAQIISADSYCGSSQWDSQCVSEVQSVCGITC
ncbi:S1/P1 nuclease-domain-containing protein [Gorgonomyces haynaldii]|nr:S1/P1 nuclease-domain-containing protein [Gorgonomyces haynaldii]